MSFHNDQNQVAAGSYHEEGAVATATGAMRRDIAFDLRGPGLVAERKYKAATPRQRIFVAHLAVRAFRPWDDVKETVAALETQEDANSIIDLLQREIAEQPKTQELEETRRSLASLKQWQFIGNLITDNEVGLDEAEGLWRTAVTKDGAKAVISQLLGKVSAESAT